MQRRHPEVQSRHDYATLRQRFVGRVAVQTISPYPGSAMQLDHDRKRPAAARNEQSRQQGGFTVSEIFHVLKSIS